MRSLLALLIGCFAISTAEPLKCDAQGREVACVVRKSCTLNGNTQKGDENELALVTRDNKLTNEDCDFIMQIKSINAYDWKFSISLKNFPARDFAGVFLYVTQDNEVKLFQCIDDSVSGDTTKYTYKKLSSTTWNHTRDNMHTGKCEAVMQTIIPTSGSRETMADALENSGVMRSEFFRVAFHDAKHKTSEMYLKKACPWKCEDSSTCKCTGQYNQLWIVAALAQGCDPAKIITKDNVDSAGNIVKVETELLGTNASIKCTHAPTSQIFIKERGGEWKKVARVFCPDHEWTYLTLEDPDGHNYHRLFEPFELKLKCDYCTYCRLDPLIVPCHECSLPHVHNEDCIPTCPNDLWWTSDVVLKTKLRCEPHPRYNNVGVWMGVNTGVAVTVEAGACYGGPYDALHKASDYKTYKEMQRLMQKNSQRK